MKHLLLPALCLISLSSCATIVSKSSYPVTIKSTGKPVKVAVKNEYGELLHTGTTPTQTTLSAKSGFFKAAKYNVSSSNSSAQITSSIDPWYAGNLLFGGLIGGLIVDPATGAMWKLPESVTLP